MRRGVFVYAVRLFAALTLWLCAGLALAEEAIDTALLRGSIVTLQPVYDGACEEYLFTLRNTLGRRGYRTASDLLEDYANGGFFNGVVVRWGDSRYILTSRHGVALSRRVAAAFAAGSARLGSCEVVYSQAASDLAILSLPADYTGDALLLDTARSDFGAGLVVAGYEGLGGEPQWVVERGHGALRRRAWRGASSKGKKREASSYIEFDATLDPGMTGSALLAEDAHGGGGLRLVGVNIWKGTLREGRAIAVSAAEIACILRQLNQKDVAGERDGESLAHLIRAGGDTLAARLSDNYLQSVSIERTFEEFDKMGRDERRGVARMFKDGEAVEGVRRILASALARAYADENLRVETDGESYELTTRDGRIPLGVARERGEWRVDDLALPPREDRKRYGLAHGVALRGTVRLGMEFPLYGREGNSASIRFSYMHWTYFFFQIGGGYGQYGFEVIDPMTEKKQVVKGSYLGLTPSLGVQLPVMLDALLLLPYARGFYGMHYSLQSRQEGFQFFKSYRAVPGFCLGADLAYRVREGLYIVGGVGVQYVLISSNFGAPKMHGFGVEVSVGIGF